MNILKFEELISWQEARKLTRDIYRLSFKPPLSKDFGLKDQVRRAAASIMLNIAEGFGGNSDQQFIQFLNYAQRSCSETQSILYICLDNNYINQLDFDLFYAQLKTIRKLCFGLIKYLKQPKPTD